MHKKLTNKPGRAVTILMVFGAVVFGYAAMWLFGYYSPTENMANAVVIQLVLIALVFGIAYAILKGVFHSQRLRNPHERELRLKDMPKDGVQTQLKH